MKGQNTSVRYVYFRTTKKSVSIQYDAVVFEKSYIVRSDISDDKQLWICQSCDKFLKKKKIPPKAQTNNLKNLKIYIQLG